MTDQDKQIQKCPLLSVDLIPLTQGKYAIVDSEDYEHLNQWKWYAAKDNKTGDFIARRANMGIMVLMSRFILGIEMGDKNVADHINHNTLDNRRCNLRKCTQQQNTMNQVSKGKTSRFKGVSWYSNQNQWVARIMIKGKHINLGVFDSEIEAAKAYDKKAKELHGEFAFINLQEKPKGCFNGR